MKRLWAPWRMKFLNQDHGKPSGCVFCVLPAEKSDEKNLILHRSAHAFTIFNKYPYNPGHLMVIPFRHTANFAELSADELLDMQRQLQQSIVVLKKSMNPQGFNIGMNLGEAGGAGIRDHLHYHVVPRWNGDASFIAVTAETRVVPQYLTETYAALRPFFAEP